MKIRTNITRTKTKTKVIGDNMHIETNLGNFGSLKDLETCMRLENHSKVIIHKADWWGTNLKLMNHLELTYAEVLNLCR